MTGSSEPLADGCPKLMRFGPCGGVHADLSCEVDARACPFVLPNDVVPLWGGTVPIRRDPVCDWTTIGPVLVDVRYPRHVDMASDTSVRDWWKRMAQALDGCSALLGEHVDNPVTTDDAGPLDPCVAIEILSSCEVPVLATVTGRDRDLAGAALTMRRFAAAGAAGIHCVTGDHPAVLGLARDVWFGAESVTLLGQAARLSIMSTVAESPASPGDRIARLRTKQLAGAAVAVLNHDGDPDALIDFADRCRDAGLDLPLFAPVPFVADTETARTLQHFPGLQLPAGLIAAVSTASDPWNEGLRWTHHQASALAASGRFAGINLSGGTTSPDPARRLDLTTDFAATALGAWGANSVTTH